MAINPFSRQPMPESGTVNIRNPFNLKTFVSMPTDEFNRLAFGIDNRPPPPPPQETPADVGVSLADYGKAMLSGGADIVGDVGWLAKQAGFDSIGGAIEQLGKDSVDYWNDSMSPAAKAELSKSFIQQNEHGEYEWGNPSLNTVGLNVAQSLLGTAATMGAGAGLTKVLQVFGNPIGRKALVAAAAPLADPATRASLSGPAQELALAALKKLRLVDEVIGATSFGAAEGLQAAGDSGMNVYDKVVNLPTEQLMKNPRYKEVYDSTDETMPELERQKYAAETVAKEASSVAGFQAGLTTALLGAPMGAFFGRLIGKTGRLGSSRLTAAGMGALGESAQEFAQSGLQAGIEDVQRQNAGEQNVQTYRDMLDQAVSGGIAGAILGGATPEHLGKRDLGTNAGPGGQNPVYIAGQNAANAGVPADLAADVALRYRDGKIDALAAVNELAALADQFRPKPAPPLSQVATAVNQALNEEPAKPLFSRPGAPTNIELPELRKRGEGFAGLPLDVKDQGGIDAIGKRYFDLAEQATKERPESATWYEDIGERVKNLAGGDYEKADRMARVLALLSSDDTVQNNVNSAVRAAYEIESGNMSPEVGRYPQVMGRYIREALGSKDISLDNMGFGNKTLAFYQNLHDAMHPEVAKNPRASTIDRWMLWAAGHPTTKTKSTAADSRNLQAITSAVTDAYNQKYGTSYLPRNLQAMIWSQHRANSGENEATFTQALDRATQKVTWEAVPSTKTAEYSVFHNSDLSEQGDKLQRATSLIRDENGRDLLAQKLGIPLTESAPSIGAYNNELHPNVVSGIVAQKVDGHYDRHAVEAYAGALQYIYKQDAVPWFRADESLSHKPDATDAVVVKVKDLNSEALLKAATDTFGEGAGFTVLNDHEVLFANYAGDPQFMEKAHALQGRYGNELGIQTVKDTGLESNYGPEVDWQNDPEGKGALSRIAATGKGSPDLQSWLRDRRKAFEEIFSRRGATADAPQPEEVEPEPEQQPAPQQARAPPEQPSLSRPPRTFDPKEIPRAEGLTPEMAAIEDRFANYLAAHYDEAAQRYNQLTYPDSTLGGKLLSVDTARELSPDYQADRSKSAAVHEPASWFIKKLYAERLAESPKPGEKPVVLFMAGGTGAGKTSGLKNVIPHELEQAQIIYDGNLAGYPSSQKKVQQALDAGKRVSIVGVYRHPIEAFRNGVLPRAMRIGRTVPIAAHIDTHTRWLDTVRQIQQHYAGDDRVQVRTLDNSRGKGKAEFVPGVDSLPQTQYTHLAGGLRDELERAREEGRINDAVYRGALGPEQPVLSRRAEGAQGVLGQAGEGDQRQPQPERPQGRLEQVKALLAPAIERVRHIVNFEVVQSVKDLPDPSVPPDVEGAYFQNGRVYLVADNLPTDQRAREVFAHEVFGHAAMERSPYFQRVLDTVKNGLTMGNAKLRGYQREVRSRYGWLSPLQEQKEILASMAEHGETSPLMERFAGAARDFARSVGIDMPTNPADVRRLLTLAGRDLVTTSHMIKDFEAAAQSLPEVARLRDQQNPTRETMVEAFQRLYERHGDKLDPSFSMPLYHGTLNAFHDYDLNPPVGRWSMGRHPDIGVHMGTLEAAKYRLKYKSDAMSEEELAPGANIRRQIVDIKNPLRVEDTGWYDPHGTYTNIRRGLPTRAAQAAFTQAVTEATGGWPKSEGTNVGTAERFQAMRDALRKMGYDGLVYENKYEDAGQDTHVIFGNDQIERYFARPQAPPDIQAMLDTLMAKPHEELSLKDRFRAWMREHINLDRDNLEQGLMDDLHSIEKAEIAKYGGLLDASRSPSKAARLTRNLPSVMAAVMFNGVPDYIDGSFQMVRGRQGFMDIFEEAVRHPDGNLLQQTMLYLAAKRANELIKQGREKLFTQEQIDTALKLKDKYPFMERIANDWEKFNGQLLDLGVKQGVLDKDMVARWKENFYVPFYRVLEEGADSGPKPGGKRLEGRGAQRLKQRLKGGDQPLGDVFGNLVSNTSYLLDEIYKNTAMQKIAEMGDGVFLKKAPAAFQPVNLSNAQMEKALNEAGFIVQSFRNTPANQQTGAKPAPANNPFWQPGLSADEREQWSKIFRRVAPTGNNIVRVFKDGKAEYYEVSDHLILRSLKSLDHQQVFDIMGLLTGSRRLLTNMVTMDPAWQMMNLVRDTLSTWIVANSGHNPVLGALKGFKAALAEDKPLWDVMMAGAGGGGYYDANPHGVREFLVKRLGGVARAQQFENTIIHPRNILRAWHRISAASENANRISVFNNVRKNGGSVAEAAYQAMDVLNFTRHGDFTAMRHLTSYVPFLNARVQGLDKLARGYKDKPAQFMLRGGILLAASLALALRNQDRKEYEELPEWDKDTYWHFFLNERGSPVGAEDHWRLPKPFEPGLLFGTIPERMWRSITGRDSLAVAQGVAGRALGSTLAFNPVPQLMKPALEQWANKDFFTGSPIVGFAEQGRTPDEQATPWTSETLRALAKGLPEWAPDIMRSPERLEHMVRAYLGTIGTYALNVSDVAVREAAGYPDGPARKIYDMPIVSRVLRNPIQNQTKYADQLYEMLDESNAIATTINHLREEQRFEDAQKLFTRASTKLAIRTQLNRIATTVRSMNGQVRAIMANPLMTPEDKRAQIDQLMLAKNQVLQNVGPIADVYD
jgi:hypothetical protein